jgi:hypothetical protein
MILNNYSPKCKEVIPLLFVTLTSAPLNNKITTISLCPHLEAVNKTELIHRTKKDTKYLLTKM